MTVELDRPFVWPEEPESYTPWNKEETKMANEDQMEYQRRQGGDRDALAVPDERRVKMREQARALLEGKQTWRPGGGRMAEGVGMYGRR